MINLIDLYVDSKMGENDKFDIAVLEDMGENGSVYEIEVRAEVANDETEHDYSGNLDEYGPARSTPSVITSLREPITPQFRAFAINLDSTTIPKNIHIAFECPKWKVGKL
ncbi:reverse transcriptase [Cucumis melo var. makuwa]|uniref:Reverse transcriptase n=1 Tax=Cucumis melo var. makuwa TaxID=1194695 RepID=A0A5A7SWM1_CUCMM|nr:reverse transcriptase [Cucumis melo var. makuwa]TYJ95632.1 reverse transcriptase [Cucumis melo var. makuwa]